MSFLKKLFGSAPKEEKGPEPEEYDGFFIFPEPEKEQGGFRIAARIEKDVDGETKTHHLIRADTVADYDEAVSATVLKAKQVIDQQGDRIF